MHVPDRDHDAGGVDYAHTVLPLAPDLAPSDPAEPTVAPTRQRAPRHRGRTQPDVLAVIALGGMLGASARYGVAQLLPTLAGGFPWATFIENLSGSFLLGLLLVLLLERFPPSRYLRPFLATGILGAFTTMSTYQLETALLIKDGQPLTALVYGLGSLAAGLVFAYAGILAGRLTPPRHTETTR
jgi:fluoride exporter